MNTPRFTQSHGHVFGAFTWAAALATAVLMSPISAVHAQTADQAAALQTLMQQQGSSLSLDQLKGMAAGAGALGGAGAQGQLPTLPKMPDLGATDAQRNPLGAPYNTTPQAAAPVVAPSQFQRFVQQSTGKLLPVFGSELFNPANTLAADSAAPAPAEYVMGAGDEVRLQLWGSVDFAGSQTIDRNGTINVPKVGAINLAGVQVKDLEATLRKQVARVYKNFEVSASLGKLRGVTVYVVGQAQRPGTYNLSSLSTLVNAVFASGGPNPSGTMRAIALKRGGKTVATLDVYDLIARGDKTQDALLQPGDVIMIAPALAQVAVTGATDHGAIYEIKPGETVQDVLALGGGVPALAQTGKALLERIGPDAQAPRKVLEVNLAQGQAPAALQDGDVLTLLPITPAFGNAITLQGAVAMPLRHKWFTGMKVQDLIPDRQSLISNEYYRRKNQLVQNRLAELKAQGLTPDQILAIQKAQALPQDPELVTEILSKQTLKEGEQLVDNSQTVTDRVRSMSSQINWDYAVIERLDKTQLRTNLISFSLAKAIDKDPANNLELQPGDVVTIMSSKDLKLPAESSTRLVRVEGEVKSPGVYQLWPGETLQGLLERIGGTTPQAYVYGTIFTRDSVRQQQQKNLDQLVRRLETQLQSGNADLVANLKSDNAAQAQAIMQQQREEMKMQIARLKSLKSAGRVALELDPALDLKTAALPNVPLEDGDSITIPSLPSFVAALGSVNNENVFIYKNGKTVSDVIASAGLSGDADKSEAFVLRADGSVISRSAAGLFSSFDGTRLMPGDTVFVPPKQDRETGYNFFVRAMKDWTSILSNFGIGAASLKALGY